MDRMRWIHADALLRDLRVLPSVSAADMQIDISPSAQLIDNTWSMTLPVSVWQAMPITEGHFVYSPGTEWGGPVTLIQHSTMDRTVTVQGPTWRGLLHQRRIYPPSGEAYLNISADANSLIYQVVGSSFGSLFSVSSASAGVTVSASYRYQTMASGIQNTLRNAGLRLDVAQDYSSGGVLLSAESVSDLTGTVEISQDYGVNFTSEIGNTELANHCLALGSGELAARLVLNLYRVGTVVYPTRPETLPEADVRTVLLDYPNAESESELIRAAMDRLLETGPAQSISVDEMQIEVPMSLGDRIPVRDRVTGLTAVSEVTGKILTISEGRVSVSAKIAVLTYGTNNN